MKLTILKKTIKEGVSERTGSPYKISSLFVKFGDEKTYNKIVELLKSKGQTIEKIEKFCKGVDYKGSISYTCGLNCSNFTFDKVEQFGVLDANVIFQVTESGFTNAKIQVVDRKEQVNGYEPPQSEVEGWANSSAEPSQKSEPEKSSLETESSKIVGSYPKPIDDYSHSDDLPF